MNALPGAEPPAAFARALALLQQGDAEQAFALTADAAARGYPPARLQLARMRLHGIGTAADVSTAVRELLACEAAGDATASYLLATIAVGGVALPRDPAINQRLQRALSAGVVPALRAAAIHFGRKPAAEDQALCEQLLRDAGDRGDLVCSALLLARLQQAERAEAAILDALQARLDAAGMAPLPMFDAPLPQQPPGPSRHLDVSDALFRSQSQLLHQHPEIHCIDGLLSADECRLLMLSAMPHLRRSRTWDASAATTEAREIRTSSDASFDPVMEDLALRLVQLRMCAAAGLDLAHAERLIVLHYLPGQEYRPHRDYLTTSALAADRPQAGNRRRTICAYLCPTAAGGATGFPLQGIEVAPAPGRAVVFDNLAADGTPEPDSQHAGTPVVEGEKWLATLWLRQGRYRDF